MLTLHDIPGDHLAQIHAGPVAIGTATGLTAAWYAPYDCIVTAVRFLPCEDATGDDTDTVNLNALLYDGSPAEIGNYDLPTGTDLEAGVPVALDISADGVAVDAGQSIMFQVELVGTGIALGAGAWLVTYKGA